jgi:hypothetical protein
LPFASITGSVTDELKFSSKHIVLLDKYGFLFSLELQEFDLER